jgi:hypothetical protein
MRASIYLLSMALLAGSSAQAAPLVTVFGDSYASGFSDWGWSETSSVDTAVKKTGLKSIKSSINASWGAYSPSKSSGNYLISQIAAISFDINPGAAANVAKVAALNLYIENSSVSGPAVSIAAYATPAIAANTWSSVRVPIAALKGSLADMSRIDLQDGAGGGAFKFNIDNLVIEAAAAPSPTPVPTVNMIRLSETRCRSSSQASPSPASSNGQVAITTVIRSSLASIRLMVWPL